MDLFTNAVDSGLFGEIASRLFYSRDFFALASVSSKANALAENYKQTNRYCLDNDGGVYENYHLSKEQRTVFSDLKLDWSQRLYSYCQVPLLYDKDALLLIYANEILRTTGKHGIVVVSSNEELASVMEKAKSIRLSVSLLPKQKPGSVLIFNRHLSSNKLELSELEIGCCLVYNADKGEKSLVSLSRYIWFANREQTRIQYVFFGTGKSPCEIRQNKVGLCQKPLSNVFVDLEFSLHVYSYARPMEIEFYPCIVDGTYCDVVVSDTSVPTAWAVLSEIIHLEKGEVLVLSKEKILLALTARFLPLEKITSGIKAARSIILFNPELEEDYLRELLDYLSSLSDSPIKVWLIGRAITIYRIIPSRTLIQDYCQNLIQRDTKIGACYFSRDLSPAEITVLTRTVRNQRLTKEWLSTQTLNLYSLEELITINSGKSLSALSLAPQPVEDIRPISHDVSSGNFNYELPCLDQLREIIAHPTKKGLYKIGELRTFCLIQALSTKGTKKELALRLLRALSIQ
jgi:hypothetical protein